MEWMSGHIRSCGKKPIYTLYLPSEKIQDNYYPMAEKTPTSFKVFIAVAFITLLVIIIANLFSYYRVDSKYAMILAFLMFVALAFTTVGIYAGIKYKTSERKAKMQNTIGLIGNLVIFLFTIGLMALAAFTNAS
jgi:hypothetical protein